MSVVQQTTTASTASSSSSSAAAAAAMQVEQSATAAGAAASAGVDGSSSYEHQLCADSSEEEEADLDEDDDFASQMRVQEFRIQHRRGHLDAADDDATREAELMYKEGDPLYDPALDDQDKAWVAQQVKRHQTQNHRGVRTTDAVLQCPGCLADVCFDCQRHEREEQYRAMFVCEERLVVQREREVRPTRATDLEPDMKYHPVFCAECQTQMGVMDSDEVYHFFNVVAVQPTVVGAAAGVDDGDGGAD